MERALPHVHPRLPVDMRSPLSRAELERALVELEQAVTA